MKTILRDFLKCLYVAVGPIVCLCAVAADVPQSADHGKEPKLTVVTTSSHCDWQWEHSRTWHEERYAQVIHDVLLLMRKYPRYVWQLENVNEELLPFLKKAGREWPEMVDEFWRRVGEGRIEVIVGYSNPRFNEVYPETTIRNLVLGRQYFRRYSPGIKQPVYNAVDVMVGHSQIPQILANTDYKYFMFSRPCKKKMVFWRTGLDGTKMLSALLHYGYQGLSTNGIVLDSMSGDDILPSEDLAKKAETWDPSKKVLSSSVRFFEEHEKSGGTLPELSGVLDSIESFACTMGLFGNNNIYTRNNQNEDLLLNAEKAQVITLLLGNKRPSELMDSIWQDLLSCVGHAIVWGWKADYEERLGKTQQTRAAGEKALHESLSSIVAGIRFNEGAGSPLVVFNFQGWPVTSPVEVVLNGEPGRSVLLDGKGDKVPMQLVEGRGVSRFAFVAQDVPACGYKTYYLAHSDHDGPVAPRVQQASGPIENDLYEIQLSANGSLHVFDKRRGANLGVAAGGLGDVVLYDAPVSDNWQMNGPLGKRHGWETQSNEFQVCRGPVFESLSAEGRIGPHKIKREVRLWRKNRRIDFLVDIEAGDGAGVFYFRCPLGSGGHVFAGIPFGAEPRENFGNEPFRGESFALGYPDAYYATRWTDVSADDFGYTLISPGGIHNGYTYKPQEQALELALLRVRPMPKGVWAQVHPWIQGKGKHHWQCALVPHQATWRETATYRDAAEFHTPLLVFSPSLGIGQVKIGDVPATSGRYGDASSFAEIKPFNVVLSSMRLVRSEASDEMTQYELRLYETTGKASDVIIRLANQVKKVESTNFLGEPNDAAGKINYSGNEIRFHILPWKIVTLRIKGLDVGSLKRPGGS